MQYLILQKNEVISRDKLLDEIWGTDVLVTPRTVDTHIANLRKKSKTIRLASKIYPWCTWRGLSV
ncbi:MAG: winged helix-turn-helix transcriptional regulator [Calditrichaeota bacterium]|nr:winged helix-turn-helix transcriptional regulator [Calditrichota bacterium]